MLKEITKRSLDIYLARSITIILFQHYVLTKRIGFMSVFKLFHDTSDYHALRPGLAVIKSGMDVRSYTSYRLSDATLVQDSRIGHPPFCPVTAASALRSTSMRREQFAYKSNERISANPTLASRSETPF
jgi:hypothetical protein